MTTSIKNVSSKLLKAIAKVGGKVPKTGYNSFSKYFYMTESDINSAVLPALLEQGLLLTTSVTSCVETPSSSENKNRFASVTLTHQIIDTESGESLTFQSVGTGADTLDKAVYKALTGSCKYSIMKLFQISGDDSDPENDSHSKPVENKVPQKQYTKSDVEVKTKVVDSESKIPNKFPAKASGFPAKESLATTKSSGFTSKPKVEVKTVEETDDIPF